MSIFYSTIAAYWPLVSPLEEYEGETLEILRVLEARAPHARTLLELGSGGGHVAHHLKQRFSMTLTDLSPEMLDVSRRHNPDCEHISGDMRTLDLQRRFDVVLAHDAIDYMTCESDLEAAIATAHRHLAPDGLALLVPDHVAERYEPGSDEGGRDGDDGRAIRFLEWSLPVEPGATTGSTHYAFLVREIDGSMRSYHEEHRFGLWPTTTWVRLLEEGGFEVEVVEEETDEDRVPRLFFVGRPKRR